jgi:solute carrier family 25 (mitochondrial iron transporter), member 28/37
MGALHLRQVLLPTLQLAPPQVSFLGVAGILATMANEAFMNPFDTIKQRMQAEASSQHYRDIFECAVQMYRNEGLRAFYLSFPTTMLLSIPFQGIQFPVYEFSRAWFNPSGEYCPQTHILSGSISGAVASAATTPIDVIKTMLQTRGASVHAEVRKISSMHEAARFILKTHGLKGFWRGTGPRILTHTPSTAVCWTTYEYFKYLLSLRAEAKE